MRLDKSVLDGMGPAELRRYVEFLLWHYQVMDGFWFIYATEAFGQGAAEQLNERVWGRVGGMAAKDLAGRFGIVEKGLDGLVEVLRLYPWTLLIGYEVERRKGAVVLRVPSCPALTTRILPSRRAFAQPRFSRSCSCGNTSAGQASGLTPTFSIAGI